MTDTIGRLGRSAAVAKAVAPEAVWQTMASASISSANLTAVAEIAL